MNRGGSMRGVFGVSMAVLFCIVGATGQAQAVSVAVSTDTMTNFFFSGQGVLESNPGSTGFDSATYNASNMMNTASCPGVGPCNPGGLSANPPQATAGPGPFPGQDTYTQPPAGGFTGSRADANINSVSFNGPGGAAKQGTAETRVAPGNTGSGLASESIGTTLTLNVATALSFSFTGDPYLQVGVDAAGNNAVASLVTFIEVSLAGVDLFRWTPGMAAGQIGVASETSPFSLNTTFMANAPADNFVYNPAADTFRATSIVIPAGTYILSLFQDETVRATAAAVPEPATLLLLGLGLGIGVAVSRRRRQA
jgi:hypothetical protein